MATSLQFDCPHCLTRRAGFAVVFKWSDRTSGTRAYLLAICGVCNLGIILQSRHKAGTGHPDLAKHVVEYPSTHYEIEAAWPSADTDYPAGIPENVHSFYVQGIENLRARRWDAAGAMFRKTLDVATKIVAPDLKGKPLFQRINDLLVRGLLTPAMGDWSHEIRLDGNDAVHDEEPETESDAVAAQGFTEAFLRYTFTLPAMVAENRQKRVAAVAE